MSSIRDFKHCGHTPGAWSVALPRLKGSRNALTCPQLFCMSSTKLHRAPQRYCLTQLLKLSVLVSAMSCRQGNTKRPRTALQVHADDSATASSSAASHAALPRQSDMVEVRLKLYTSHPGYASHPTLGDTARPSLEHCMRSLPFSGFFLLCLELTMRRRVAQLCKSIKTYMDRCWDMSEHDLHVHQYLIRSQRGT